jgi:hypothetical protein
VLFVSIIAFVRLYFVPEYGFYRFFRRFKATDKSTLRLIVFSAEHVPPLDPPKFRVCLRSSSDFHVDEIRVYGGAWLNEQATQLIDPATGKKLDQSQPTSSYAELVLVLRGMAGAGSIRVEIDLRTPGSTSGELPVDVELYSVSGATHKSAADIVKERSGLSVRQFGVNVKKFGRTSASLILGVALSGAAFVYARIALVPRVLGREAVADKLADASAWDVGLVCALFLFAVEFAAHRWRAGYPFRSTACGYQRPCVVWKSENQNADRIGRKTS